MEFTAKQIAGILNGQIEGNADVKITKLSKIEEGEPGSISFLANPAYTHYIYDTKASLVIVNKDFTPTAPVSSTLIRVESAAAAFAKLLEMYNQVKLNNTTLFAGVKIYSDCQVGKDCIIHSGTVIGSDGFRFEPQNEGNKKVPQIGNVIIEDDVEIGANCAIDRATLGSTILRKGVKFDNLVHIAHNVEIGENSYLAACNVVAGSTKIGKNCMFSGQVGIVGHLQIADNTIITAQSGISKSITKPGEVYMGSPAFDANKYRKAYIHFRNLDSIVQRINKIEKEN